MPTIRASRARSTASIVLATVLLLGLSACDIGWHGTSYAGASGSPSGSKPESKVWFNDGTWWAELFDTATGDFYVHRLDIANHTWVKTTTRLDHRSNSRSDILWDGTHLYVASHAFAEGTAATPLGQAYLRRFSYNTQNDTYTLDRGFPKQINNVRSETLVIDKDSQGRIWATWVQNQQVMVSVSSVGGTSWGTPFALPAPDSQVATDDISSLVAFGGNKIGVMWTNENVDKTYFVIHNDADPVGTWRTPEIAFQGLDSADDHINLKNVNDQNGRILAAVKTDHQGPNDTLVQVLDRNPVTGVWTSHRFGTKADHHTRPVLVVDKSHQVLHVFATSGEAGGAIYEKTAPLANIQFAPGLGDPVLQDEDNPDINNATTTKQAVDSTTGLVVLATNDTTREYWTHYDPLTD